MDRRDAEHGRPVTRTRQAPPDRRRSSGGPVYTPTTARRITRRGIMWLGLTCNLRCRFCYFLDRIEDPAHPEHPFIGLDKAKAICRTLVGYYGNSSVDIQGGEPTLYPGIEELVAYCAGIGLSPTLITNGLALADPGRVAALRDAGVRDFLVSVQGLGSVYDHLVRRPGAHALQRRALENIRTAGVPFRLNTVLTNPALAQLEDMATLAIDTGAGVVNFLGYNPFNDQELGRREEVLVPSYDELRSPLMAAIDRLATGPVEVNVRYLPLCLLPEAYRPHLYGYRQLPYDLHENDYASWSWTELPAQRTAGMPLTPPFGLGRRLQLGPLRRPLRVLDRRWPRLGGGLHTVKQALERHWADGHPPGTDPDSLAHRYQQDAAVRAGEYTGYRHVGACQGCDLRPICDGVYGDYPTLFGTVDVRPVRRGSPVTDPQHYTRLQYKVVHPLDREWLEAPRDDRMASATGADPARRAGLSRRGTPAVRWPNFFLIGAGKAGTTSLYHYLRQHPEIYMSRFKEPKFFALAGHPLDFRGPHDDRIRAQTTTTESDYLALFDGVADEKAIGEASTIYLGDFGAADAIAARVPEARIAAILRHPAERAFSAYQHLLRDGYEPLPTFEAALEAEPRRKADGWYVQYEYLGRGFYGRYLEHYYERFDPSRIRVYLYDDFAADPLAVLADLFAFLDVDPGFRPDMRPRHNVSGRPRNARLQRWLTRRHPAKEALKRWIPEDWGHRLITRVQPLNVVREELEPATRRRLIDAYRDDILQLQTRIDRDLSHWLARP